MTVEEYLQGGLVEEDNISYLFRNSSGDLQDSQKMGIEALAMKNLKNLGVQAGSEQYKELMNQVRTNLKNNKIVRITRETLLDLD
jgi:hypothetical protein